MTAFEKLFGLIRKNEKRTGSDYTATVTRVKDGIAYVQIAGAEINDTPVSLSVDAKPGDVVRVRINNGKAWLTGNDTSPPNNNTQQLKEVMDAADAVDQRLGNVESKVARLEIKSHIGMVIMSTTLATHDQVVAQYGGTTWIQHSGYFLYGASTNVVANSAAATGGEASHTLTVNEIPSHYHPMTEYYANSADIYGAASGALATISSVPQTMSTNTDSIGGGLAHNNMPPYKNVYIWERTA